VIVRKLADGRYHIVERVKDAAGERIVSRIATKRAAS
jgi:hypothetical protein